MYVSVRAVCVCECVLGSLSEKGGEVLPGRRRWTAGEPTGGQTERSETQEWCPLCNDRRARRPGRVMGIISLVPIFFHDTQAREAPLAVSGKQLKPDFSMKTRLVRTITNLPAYSPLCRVTPALRKNCMTNKIPNTNSRPTTP